MGAFWVVFKCFLKAFLRGSFLIFVASGFGNSKKTVQSWAKDNEISPEGKRQVEDVGGFEFLKQDCLVVCSSL